MTNQCRVSSVTQQVVMRKLSELRPFARNARRHSRKQVRQIARSIERFGFTNPILVADDGEIIAGHGRAAAAKQLGLTEIPTIALSSLSEAERRAYVIADNKLALNSGWDHEVLGLELEALAELEFDVELTGFSSAEIDLVIEEAHESQVEGQDRQEDYAPPLATEAVSRPRDLWRLGRHRLMCADARDPSAYRSLLGNEIVDLIFTDPPYNVPITGHVCGLGNIKHPEFPMASGELSTEAFTDFLTKALRPAAAVCREGAIAFVCMDWRHMRELLAAGATAFDELKNLVVWNKTKGGMGSFYRSKHELIFVFKARPGEHVNTFGLGGGGRYRTNVWDYPGVNASAASTESDLRMHPTVKPAALVADALRDCSKRGDVVLDQFGGSGTTLIAAEKVGRRARLIEIDPLYCDTIIRRWQTITQQEAILEKTGRPFDETDASIEEMTST